MELKNYFAILRRWGWIMVLCTLLAGLTSYWYTSRQPKVYQSRARYLIGPAIDSPTVTTNDLRASGQIGQTYNELVTSRPILQSVIGKLKLDTTPDLLREQVSGSFIETTQLLSIRANAVDPDVAAKIANAVGDTLIEQSPNSPTSKQTLRRQEAESEIVRVQETILAIQAEIDQLTNQVQQTTDLVSQRALIVRLDERRSRLATSQRAYSDLFQLLQTSNVNQIKLVESAVPAPDAPIAPDIQRNVLAAMIAGLVLGLVAMMLLEYFNDVIYTPEVLRKATGLIYLGGLARHKRLRGSKGSQLVTIASPETLATESFRILRTNLQIAGTDRHLPSLLITSPSRGDGKSDIAANLAVTLARAGKMVILIDANLRRPQLATLFGLPDQHGLAQLLDSDRLPEPVEFPSVPGLFILPAGGSAANSSEILGSQRMYRLIQEFKSRADVVLIDSPPLWYSDALALAPQVDGVLLAVSSGTTGRENTINAVESLRLVGARVIGTVLNRVKAGPAYFYYPTYMANRNALASSNAVASIGASMSPRALSAAKVSPGAQADAAKQRPASALPDVVPSGLVAPAPPDSGDSDQVAAASQAEQPALKTTVVLETVAPDTADASAASSSFDAPSADAVTADDSEWGHAIGSPLDMYGKADEPNGEFSATTSMNMNGQSSAARRRGKSNH